MLKVGIMSIMILVYNSSYHYLKHFYLKKGLQAYALSLP